MNSKTLLGCWLLYSLLFALPVVAGDPPPISLVTLAREMIDRDGRARLPFPAYQQLQASSWDRTSSWAIPRRGSPITIT